MSDGRFYTNFDPSCKANNELRLSPKDTMKSCQSLYEAGYITYMRTDSKTYSREFIDIAKTSIENKFGEEYANKDIYSLCRNENNENDDKLKKKSKNKSKNKSKENENNAQEAHEAIRPTNIDLDILPSNQTNIGTREIKLYNLIYRNTLESCMEAAIYLSITETITSPDDHMYKYSTEQVVFPGWKIVG